MFTNRISSKQIEYHRIEAEFYDPQKLEKLDWINSWKSKVETLKDACEMVTDGTHITPKYTQQGIKFLSSKNISPFTINFDDVKTVSLSDHIKLGNANCNPKINDILISKSGKTGTVALYRDGYERCSLFEGVALIRYKGAGDLDFIVAFLNSSGGWFQFTRLSKTMVISHIHLEDIREIKIPKPIKEVQNYIGDKVRLAEKLRERSKYLMTSAKVILESLLVKKITEEDLFLFCNNPSREYENQETKIINQLIQDLDNYDHNSKKDNRSIASKWTRRCSFLELESRIDSYFYNPDAVLEIEKVKQWNPKPLSEYVAEKRSEPPIHTNHYSKDGISIISPANFTDFKIDLKDTNKLDLAYKELFSEFLMQEENVVFSLVGDVGHACIVTNPAPLAITYRRTAHLKLKNINPYLVTLFLNCRAGDLQLKRMTTGVIQAQLRLEDSVEILIPTFTKNIQDYIGEKVRLSLKMQEQEEKLTTAAKYLVEALIEGKLTETELKNAQTALQKGDIEPDKAILAKLTRKGYDIANEPPLFPDLDALYQATREINL